MDGENLMNQGDIMPMLYKFFFEWPKNNKVQDELKTELDLQREESMRDLTKLIPPQEERPVPED